MVDFKNNPSGQNLPENLSLESAQTPITDFRGLILTIIAGIVGVASYFLLPYGDMANRGLAILIFVGILWFTEAVHITVTALMVPLLAVFCHIPDMTAKTALAHFSDPIIFVFFGGFALATALHMQRLDRKIAMWVISLSGGNMWVAVLLIFAVTAFLSMWISNTATAAMMLPLAMGLMSHLDREKEHNTYVFVLLGIAYCASIGGLGTLVGSPPNAIAAKALGLDFSGWMAFGLPMMLALLPVMVFSLVLMLRPNFKQRVNTLEKEDIPWTLHRVITVVIFVSTATAWIGSKQIGAWTGVTKGLDSLIAVAAAVAVVVFGTVRWREVARNTDWGVLMLFGGGIALSSLMDKSGASAALGNEVAQTFGGASPLVVIVVVAAFIVFLTEFTSNTASAALLVPVFATIAAEMGMPKEVLVMIIGIGASCAFMLPVATPPNAIVFGTGLIRQKEMMRVGVLLNLLCIAAVSLWAYFFLM
ncbi:SLC13 family permease [Conchiformibius kuhniae]|uniref:SLC13 family permease n=1 Tax=Conchiformibius kuhniae TaxID=211502 RepID=A0A8T9MUD1_9NEIS|nr:SLC13 family permease [Conchiformibius kuhniae]UOP04445.1 SLC13 family permease [Conchiformibius kuhniae]